MKCGKDTLILQNHSSERNKTEVQLLPSRLGESPTRHRHVLAEWRSA